MLRVWKVNGEVGSDLKLLEKLMKKIDAAKMGETGGGEFCTNFSGSGTHKMKLTKS